MAIDTPPDVIRVANGPAIATIRALTGSNGATFAMKAMVSAPYLSNIEAGRKFPPVEVLARFARELGVPLDAISVLRQPCATCGAPPVRPASER